VTTGDYIGLVRGDGIVAINRALVGCATSLVDHLVSPGRELVTVIVGEGAARADVDAVVAHVRAAGLEVEIHDGGQPLYPFLFGAE
jgi:dihydroxyacetone kinase-like predicted kinase